MYYLPFHRPCCQRVLLPSIWVIFQFYFESLNLVWAWLKASLAQDKRQIQCLKESTLYYSERSEMFAIGQSAFFATLLIVSLFTTGTNSLLYWNQTLPNSFLKPSPRQYGSLAWTATALYLFGGQAEDGALSKHVKYNIA